ncbi:MAG: hypothetical protein ABWZ16_06025 [Microbacterium sp.]
MKVGQRYRSENTTTQVIVMRGTADDITLECAGLPMVALDPTSPPPGPSNGAAGPNALQVGKRYTDEATGLEVLCTAAGEGPVSIDGRPLVTAAAKLLPSSD